MMIFSRIRGFLFPKSIANDGSQLRDHLANERTFLSWTRMGLAFAAMALALGRLGMIDRVLTREFGSQSITGPEQQQQQQQTETAKTGQDLQPRLRVPKVNDFLISQACWSVSIWSFGYGIYRYVSIRRNLLHGRFTPAIWGPVVITCASLGSVGMYSPALSQTVD